MTEPLPLPSTVMPAFAPIGPAVLSVFARPMKPGRGLAAGDLDGDGDLDLVLGDADTLEVHALMNDGS